MDAGRHFKGKGNLLKNTTSITDFVPVRTHQVDSGIKPPTGNGSGIIQQFALAFKIPTNIN